MANTFKIVVSTREFENTHGKSPKGFGCWVYKAEDVELWLNGNYGETKKAAIHTLRHIFTEEGYEFPVLEIQVAP